MFYLCSYRYFYRGPEASVNASSKVIDPSFRVRVFPFTEIPSLVNRAGYVSGRVFEPVPKTFAKTTRGVIAHQHAERIVAVLTPGSSAYQVHNLTGKQLVETRIINLASFRDTSHWRQAYYRLRSVVDVVVREHRWLGYRIVRGVAKFRSIEERILSNEFHGKILGCSVTSLEGLDCSFEEIDSSYTTVLE